jgi:hypothetical protein
MSLQILHVSRKQKTVKKIMIRNKMKVSLLTILFYVMKRKRDEIKELANKFSFLI